MRGKTLLEIFYELKENLEKYIETKLSYIGLSAFEKAVKLMVYIASHSVILVIFTIALLFLSGAAAIYIGKLLSSYELGMLIIGGFYVLIGLIFYIFREKIFSPNIIKALLKIFFPNEEK